MKIRFHIIFVLFLSSQLCYGGAWNKDKGHGYMQFSYTYLSYHQLLNSGGSRIDLKRSINDYTFQFYGEYGLSNKFNLILNLPYKMVSSGNEINNVTNDPYINDTLDAGNLNGISNIGVGLRFKLVEKNYVLTAQIDFYNLMHQYQPNSGMRIGYDAYLIYPSILYGKGWSKYYLQLQTGLMINSSNYSQNTFGNLEIGRKFWEGKSYFIFRLDYKIPITTGTFNEENSVQTGLFRDNSVFISPGFKWIQQLREKLFLNLGVYGAVYSKREGANATLNVGIAYDW